MLIQWKSVNANTQRETVFVRVKSNLCYSNLNPLYTTETDNPKWSVLKVVRVKHTVLLCLKISVLLQKNLICKNKKIIIRLYIRKILLTDKKFID